MPDPIRYHAHGARHHGGQLPRIEDGFRALGAVEAPEDDSRVDLIYANDEPRWAEAIQYREKVAPGAKLILNVLDIPEHSPNLDLADLWSRLRHADVITAISPFVVSQVQRLFGRNADLIWNPIKDINSAERRAGKRSYPFKVMMVGRLRDPGKRAELAIRALISAGYDEKEVAMVGGEWPHWGTDMGVVSDETLNSLYNSVDMVLMASSWEGLGLPCYEAMAGGALPVVCHDLTTFADTGMPRRWGCYPSAYSLAHRLLTLNNNPALYREERAIAEQIGERVIEQLSGKAVAERILSVYRHLSISCPTPPPQHSPL